MSVLVTTAMRFGRQKLTFVARRLFTDGTYGVLSAQPHDCDALLRHLRFPRGLGYGLVVAKEAVWFPGTQASLGLFIMETFLVRTSCLPLH